MDITCSTMGRQATIIAVLCLLAVKGTLSQIALKNVLQDNESAESAPRLYRNVPVYASSAPYASYSIQVPTFLTAPKASASRIVPVKEAFQNSGYLRDSYGNRFDGSSQPFAYKAAFPQQFLQLQELPSHLSQPLVAAAANYQYNRPAPFNVGSHYTLPLQGIAQHSFNAPQQIAYPDAVKAFAPSSSYQAYGHPTAQQQSTSNRAVFANVHLNNGQQFQRLQQVPKDVEIIKQGAVGYNNDKEQLQAAPNKETYITTVVNGQKTLINVETKPALPLLDLSLLEPLTFENPLVPQVQHFLPRISQATYHKLPNAFDAIQKGKARKASPKKKQKRPSRVNKSHDEESPVNPPVTIKDVSKVSPDISYEINSPNYKETYNEQAITYDKETQSEPIHYTYGSKSEKNPVYYSYVHNTKEPLKLKESHYESDEQHPKQLIYKFKNEEYPKENEDTHLTSKHESKHSREREEVEEEPENNRSIELNEDHEESPNTHHQNKKQGQEEDEQNDTPNQEHHREIEDRPKQYYSQPRQNSIKNAEEFHPRIHNEENIRLVPEHKTAHIRVDPNQHVQNGPSEHNPQSEPSPQPPEQSHEPQEPHNYEQDHPAPSSRPHIAGPQHRQEKSRRVIMLEETPDEMHSLREQVMAEVVGHEENNEEDFEKAYKNSAFGFPAYNQNSEGSEKEIYNPENYGVSRGEYDVEHAPFQQYQDEGDQYPKTTRLSYKDARDKTKEDYFLDYSISRPESLTDRYKNKVDYYKLFKEQKPERYVNRDEQQKKENEKYKAYVFKPVPEEKQQHYAKYKAAPQLKEYDYFKEQPRDNSAYASRPLQQYKSKTYFVEPQYQYGFEPILSMPLLLDSELATMASNNSPESEKPEMMRKKVYKENWYIKKTKSSGNNS